MQNPGYFGHSTWKHQHKNQNQWNQMLLKQREANDHKNIKFFSFQKAQKEVLKILKSTIH